MTNKTLATIVLAVALAFGLAVQAVQAQHMRAGMAVPAVAESAGMAPGCDCDGCPAAPAEGERMPCQVCTAACTGAAFIPADARVAEYGPAGSEAPVACASAAGQVTSPDPPPPRRCMPA